jgi:hypothetical protein
MDWTWIVKLLLSIAAYGVIACALIKLTAPKRNPLDESFDKSKDAQD